MSENIKQIAVCGIYCGACPHKLGKIRESSRSLRDLLDGWNFGDVAQFILPPGMNYNAFREVLSALSSQEPCQGCRDEGNALCPIKVCAKKKSVATCADCGQFVGSLDNPCENAEPREIFKLISRRYSGWNLENLKRIRQVGIEKFMEEMEKKVADGFTTCEAISKGKVFSR